MPQKRQAMPVISREMAQLQRMEILLESTPPMTAPATAIQAVMVEKLSSRLLFHWWTPAKTSTTTFRESLIREESRKMQRKVMIRMIQPFTPKLALTREISSFCAVCFVLMFLQTSFLIIMAAPLSPGAETMHDGRVPRPAGTGKAGRGIENHFLRFIQRSQNCLQVDGGVIGLLGGPLHGAGPDAVADLSDLVGGAEEAVGLGTLGLHAGAQHHAVGGDRVFFAIFHIGNAVGGDALAPGPGQRR